MNTLLIVIFFMLSCLLNLLLWNLYTHCQCYLHLWIGHQTWPKSREVCYQYISSSHLIILNKKIYIITALVLSNAHLRLPAYPGTSSSKALINNKKTLDLYRIATFNYHSGCKQRFVFKLSSFIFLWPNSQHRNAAGQPVSRHSTQNYSDVIINHSKPVIKTLTSRT